jgi:zinc resistance-associated protein
MEVGMKRSGLKTIIAVSTMCIALASAGAIRAEGMHDGPERGKGEHECRLKSSWKETLTDSQKTQLEKLHLAMKKDTSVLRAELGVKKAELKALALKDNPDTQAISRKTDEIMGIKKELMQKRIGHLIEVRKVLTPEQRVSFDSAVMSGREGHGHRHGDWHKG